VPSDSVDKDEPPIDLQKQLDRGLPEHGRELPEADHLYMSVIEWRPDRQVDFLVGGMAEEKASADATCCRSQGRLASVSFEYTNRTEKTIARRSRGRFFS